MNDKEKNVLALGYNYATKERHLDSKNIIVDVEKACIAARILDSKINNNNNLNLITTQSENKNIFKRPPFEVPHPFSKKRSEKLETQLSSLKHTVLQTDFNNKNHFKDYDKNIQKVAKGLATNRNIVIGA